MIRIQDISLKWKLVVSLAGIVLVIVVINLLYFTSYYRSAAKENLENRAYILAQIQADNLPTALEFFQESEATRQLEYMAGDKELLYAYVYDETAQVFASFSKTTETPPEYKAGDLCQAKSIMGKDSLITLMPIKSSTGGCQGTLLLCHSLDQVKRETRKSNLLTLAVSCTILIGGILVSLWMGKVAITPLQDLQAEVKRISQGDLQVQLHPKGNDEIGIFTRYFQTMTNSLRQALEAIKRSAVSVNDNTDQITSTADVQKETYSSLAEVIASATTSAQELSTASKSVFERAKEVSADAKKTIGVLNQSQTDINTNLDNMIQVEDKVVSIANQIIKLGDTVLQIGEITKSVQAVASKTDLLAINAAIEANAAGEQGKGFEVVAMEIRKLSDESQKAMADIRDLISQIQGAFNDTLAETESGAKFVRDSRDWMENTNSNLMSMLTSMERTITSMEEITRSTMDQSQVVEDLTKVMDMVNIEMEKTSTAVDQTFMAVKNLKNQAQDLEELVYVYKV